jgi:integrase/recombinase XerD
MKMVENAYIREEIKNGGGRMRMFEDAAAEFLAHMKSLGRSPGTLEHHRFSIGRFFRFLDGRGISLSDADVRTIEERRISLLESGLSESTVDIHMRCVRAFYAFLEGRGLLFDNPFRKITMHRPRNKNMDVLTETEMRRLLSTCTRIRWSAFRNRAIVETLYSTGMRKGELLGLRIRDVDLSAGTARLFGKGSKERMVPLGRIAAEYIGLYLRRTRPELAARGSGDCDSLWLSHGGKRLNGPALMVLVRILGKKAGIEKLVNCHMLRRTCATHMLANGAHPFAISELLGHACLKTLSRYLRISIPELKKAHSRSRVGQ